MKHEMNYRIMYKHPDCEAEEIDQAKDISGGNFLVGEYQIAFHNQGKVWKEKIRRPLPPRKKKHIKKFINI